MKPIIFLGSKYIGYECLNYLLEHTIELDIKISAVFTSKSKLDGKQTVEELAKKSNIPLFFEADDLFKIPAVDILLSVQYHQILKKKHLKRAMQTAVNLHMAPLPEYRGCNQFSFAILDKAPTFGTTLHLMDNSVDGGPILFEKRFPIPSNCWVKELYEMTVDASIDLFKENIENIIAQNYVAMAQAHLIKERGTSFHLRKEIDAIKQIDLNWSAEKINRHIRATYFPPYEPPYTIVAGQKIFFKK